VVICLQRGADCLHTVQLMPLLPKTSSSLASFKFKLVLPFWYRLTQVIQEKTPLNGCSSSVVVVVVVTESFGEDVLRPRLLRAGQLPLPPPPFSYATVMVSCCGYRKRVTDAGVSKSYARTVRVVTCRRYGHASVQRLTRSVHSTAVAASARSGHG